MAERFDGLRERKNLETRDMSGLSGRVDLNGVERTFAHVHFRCDRERQEDQLAPCRCQIHPGSLLLSWASAQILAGKRHVRWHEATVSMPRGVSGPPIMHIML